LAYDKQLRPKLLARTAMVQSAEVAAQQAPGRAAAGQTIPSAMPLRRAARSANGQSANPTANLAGARSAATMPPDPVLAVSAADVWDNLLGDNLLSSVGPASKIGKASASGASATRNDSATKRAAERRRKLLFFAAPGASLLVAGAVAFGLMHGNRLTGDRPSTDPAGHKIAGMLPVPAKTNSLGDSATSPTGGTSPASGSAATAPPSAAPSAVSPPRVSPLVIDWPLDERAGAVLKIDDRIQLPGRAPKLELPLERGLHSVHIVRPGFSEFAQTVSIGGAEQPTIRPLWLAEDGRGLRAELFRGAQFKDKFKSRVDPMIDFMWGFGPADPELWHENFSIRWKGFIKAPMPGKYKIIGIADDSMRVSIDGLTCIDSADLVRRCEATVDLTGEPQSLDIEYVQTVEAAMVSLRWVPPGHSMEQAIPAGALFYDKQLARNTKVRDVPEPTAGGLRAQLFDDPELHHLVKTRIDRQIDFMWGFDPPDSDIPQENFSIRWDGTLLPPEVGSYTLTTFSDDGSRLWLDDALVVDNWGNHSVTRVDTAMDLQKRPYRIRVEFMQGSNSAVCSVRWIRPGQAREEVIPSSALRPAEESR
jgi:hypothetical protein